VGVRLLELHYGHDKINVLRTGEGIMKVKIFFAGIQHEEKILSGNRR
jgi:hypothetical protein